MSAGKLQLATWAAMLSVLGLSSGALWAQTQRSSVAGLAPSSRPAASESEQVGPPDGAVFHALEQIGTIDRDAPSDAATDKPETAPTAKSSPKKKPDQQKKARSSTEQGKQSTPAQAVLPYPNPYGPFYGDYAPGGSPLSSSQRDWANYRYFDGQPSRYGYGHWYRQFGDDYGGDSFRFGFMEGYDRAQFDRVGNEREEALLGHHGIHLNRGIEEFKKGNYQQAAATFQLAADIHHGDPAARLYAAHALFATGRYQLGIVHLRRAFELQPKIALLNFDMRDDYSVKADFDKQCKALESAIAQSPNNVDRLLILGYVRYYSGQRDKAYNPLSRADKLVRGGDSLARKLLPYCQPPDVELDQPAPPTAVSK